MVLLVYEEELTKNVLKNLGVPTETFTNDLKHLSGFEAVKVFLLSILKFPM